MKDGRVAARGRANTAASFVSAYLCHYFISIFLKFLLTTVAKCKFLMAETAVQPNNDVRTVMLFKINS
jgi:hypothetical protein